MKTGVKGGRRARRQVTSNNRSASLQSMKTDILDKVTAFAEAVCSIRARACPRGLPGNPGPKGDKGVSGIKGNTGKHGPSGSVGPKGPAGREGTMGPVGPRGKKGDRGALGPQGMPGERGSPGQPASAPEVIISPSNSLTVNETTIVDIYCSATGNPPARVTWRRLNGSFDKDRVTVNRSGRLRISRVRGEDRGKYECAATNILGVMRSTVSLTVNGKVVLHFLLYHPPLYLHLPPYVPLHLPLHLLLYLPLYLPCFHCNKLNYIRQLFIAKFTKIKFFRACVESILLYGAETWTISKI